MELLLLTSELHLDPVLSWLLLLYAVQTAQAGPSSLLEVGAADAALVDPRRGLSSTRGLCCLLSSRLSSERWCVQAGWWRSAANWVLDEILLPSTRPRGDRHQLRLIVGCRGG
ncbi:hypothetical protein [Mycobacterium uberis]|uniref:hypothetical protein n=1 Tax=Mycobacterium uberis TaxID=2162698 RepID=UPI003C73603C